MPIDIEAARKLAKRAISADTARRKLPEYNALVLEAVGLMSEGRISEQKYRECVALQEATGALADGLDVPALANLVLELIAEREAGR